MAVACPDGIYIYGSFCYALAMPLDDIKQARLEKLAKLKKAGIDPYPAVSERTHEINQALEDFDALASEKKIIVLAGRVMAKREHGGSVFLDVEDSTGRIQIYFKKDVLGDDTFRLFIETVDIGDFIEAKGFLFKTKKAEPTLEAQSWRMLAKSLLPLPEKWHGLQDVEERFRKRYLDLIFNPAVRENFKTRSEIIKQLRNFLQQHGFLEVATPTLQPLYGGASARPFKTHLNALDIDVFLRIAPELYLKRLLVGGFEKVFEFTTNFRNEGMDRDHNPEYSGLEFYAAYRDLDWLMGFTEDMFIFVLENIFGNTKIKYQEKEINFAKPFKRATFGNLLKEHTGIDYDTASEKDLAEKVKALGLTVEKHANRATLADEIFKKQIRPKLAPPTFVRDYPVEMLPLAKKLSNPNYVGAFQFFAGGFEMIKAFSELNDPVDQRERFKAQENKRAKGDEEAQRMDEDFIEALEYGMPPAAGWGLGIDRLVALLTDSHGIREVILFPLMKPK
ncbi:MAG: lysine--tRNA ligase [Patescibacteria group bacterium]